MLTDDLKRFEELKKQNAKPSGKGREKTKSKWTVMVYLAGDNNLAEEMIFALKGMYSVGSTEDVQVVACSDSPGALVFYDIPKRKPPKKEAVSLLVTEDNNLKATQEEYLEEIQKHEVRELEQLLADKKAELKEKTADEAKVAAPDPMKLYSDTDEAQEPTKTDERDELRLSISALAPETPVAAILAEFISDSLDRYPAEHYALILSGHGSGAVGDFLSSDKQFLSLGIPGLGEALAYVGEACDHGKAKGPWLDILGFDSCLMSMAEVAYEVRDSVEYMVAAEGFESATGWPYDRVLSMLQAPDKSTHAVASGIVREHINYYNDYTAADVSVDMSALELHKLGGVVDLLSPKTNSDTKSPGLAALLIQGLNYDAVKDAIVLAHWEAQGFKNEQYADLWDFCGCLAKRTKEIPALDIAQQITAVCDLVQKSIRKTVIASAYRGPEFQYAHGLSIFFPWADLKDASGVSEVQHYGGLAFAHDTTWDEFLRHYLKATIRRPRGESPERNGKRHHSFMNLRPFLFTGPAEKQNSNTKSSPYTLKSSPYTLKSSPYTLKMSGSGTLPPKIASMKNPAIDWYKLRENES